jgi:hypothetical protein
MKTLIAFLALSTAVFTQSVSADTIPTTDQAERTVAGQYWITGNWSALKRGWNVLSLYVTDQNSVPVNEAQVTVDYDMASHSMNPPKAQVEARGNGIYEARIFLGMRGGYRYDITVKQGDVQDELHTVHSAN